MKFCEVDIGGVNNINTKKRIRHEKSRSDDRTGADSWGTDL